ncbi:hypothetical protein MHYP_G00088420 [Metynnis hypsauchen]
MMLSPSGRCVDSVFSLMLLAIVVLSWGYVIYGTRIAAQWELEKRGEHADVKSRSPLSQRCGGPNWTLNDVAS